jgi:hypothetical protein
MGLAAMLPVLLRLFVHEQYYVQDYWRGLAPVLFSNTPFTSLWLVLRVVYCMGLTPIIPVLLHLLVHDWYYVQIYWRALLPDFQ